MGNWMGQSMLIRTVCPFRVVPSTNQVLFSNFLKHVSSAKEGFNPTLELNWLFLVLDFLGQSQPATGKAEAVPPFFLGVKSWKPRVPGLQILSSGKSLRTSGVMKPTFQGEIATDLASRTPATGLRLQPVSAAGLRLSCLANQIGRLSQ